MEATDSAGDPIHSKPSLPEFEQHTKNTVAKGKMPGGHRVSHRKPSPQAKPEKVIPWRPWKRGSYEKASTTPPVLAKGVAPRAASSKRKVLRGQQKLIKQGARAGTVPKKLPEVTARRLGSSLESVAIELRSPAPSTKALSTEASSFSSTPISGERSLPTVESGVVETRYSESDFIKEVAAVNLLAGEAAIVVSPEEIKHIARERLVLESILPNCNDPSVFTSFVRSFTRLPLFARKLNGLAENEEKSENFFNRLRLLILEPSSPEHDALLKDGITAALFLENDFRWLKFEIFQSGVPEKAAGLIFGQLLSEFERLQQPGCSLLFEHYKEKIATIIQTVIRDSHVSREDGVKQEFFLKYALELTTKIDPTGAFAKTVFLNAIQMLGASSELLPLVITTFESFVEKHSKPYSEAILEIKNIVGLFSPIRMLLAMDSKRPLIEACERAHKYILTNILVSENPLVKLEKLIKSPYSDAAVEHMQQALFQLVHESEKPLKEPYISVKRVLSIFEKLSSAPLLERFEVWPIEKIELFRTAFYLAIHAQKIEEIGKSYFSRKDTGLQRAIQFDREKEIAYISSIPRRSVLRDSGSFKKVANVIEIALEVAQEPSIKARVFTRRDITESDLREVCEEARLCRYFSGKPGMVKIFTLSELPREGHPVGVSIIFEPYQGDLSRPIREPSLLTKREVLQVCAGMIDGFTTLHIEGMAHLDGKPGNVLFKKVDPETGMAKGGVCDLGYARKVRVGFPIKPEESPGSYNKGFYGTKEYTPYEMLGEISFAGDHFKTDVWAAGISLYELRFNERVPWMSDISDYYQNVFKAGGEIHDPVLLQAMKASVRTKIEERVENNPSFLAVVRKKEAGDHLTEEEEIDFLIYSMLRINPEHRITMLQARDEVHRYLTP